MLDDLRKSMNEKDSVSPTPFRLAMLAAAIAPEACLKGDCRKALLRALEVWQQSKTLCDEITAAKEEKRIQKWFDEATPGPGGILDVSPSEVAP